VSNAFREAAHAAGIEGLRLHDLRPGYATALLRAGIHPKIVREQLGHSNIGITLDTYSHVIPSMGAAAAEAIQQAFAASQAEGGSQSGSHD
jgi:integrase